MPGSLFWKTATSALSFRGCNPGAAPFFLESMLRFTTAGESHGPALVSILEGMVAGLPLVVADIDTELARRQQGYGRGRRMKIESDHAEFLSGVRGGERLGARIACVVQSRDGRACRESRGPAPREGDPERKRAVTRPRPGHVDLSG